MRRQRVPRFPLRAAIAAVLLLASVFAFSNSRPPSWFATPALAENEPTVAARLLAEGRSLVEAGRPGDAYPVLAASLRAATDQGGKDAARDVLLALPPSPFPGLTDAERDIVSARIDEERTRYLRERANALLSGGRLRGALKILDVIKGTLEEESTALVIGDPASEERRSREVSDLKLRIFGDLSPEEKARAERIKEESGGEAPRLWRAVETLRKEKQLLVARRVLTEILFQPAFGEEWKARARAALDDVEARILDDLSREERSAVDAALTQPVFGRLKAITSREFIYIGDSDLVARIPERSRHLLDLAYIAITDLCGRVPNPGGERVTIFFKELWDFGGGIGGGTRIDIGRANPKDRAAVLVSTGLFFHELCHCVFDLHPGFPGWTEGIANFGAAFAMQFLRLETDTWHSAQGNLEAFRRDFLGREEAYWRMAPYGPSAGWFLHFADAHGRRPGGDPDWVRWGRIFRGWRGLDPEPETVHGLARAFSHLLVTEFGAGAWTDLASMGFPCEGGPEEAALDARLRAGLLFQARSGDLASERELIESHSGSAAAAAARRLAVRRGTYGEEGSARLAAEAGFLFGWRICGPFYAEPGSDALATAQPPESTIDFAAEYRTRQDMARWRSPAADGPVAEDSTGQVTVRWAYPADAITYGVLDLQLPAAVDAWAWVGTDHRWALWIDDHLVEKQEWAAWRMVEDRDRVPVKLPAGRVRLLFKAVAGHVGSTFAVRLTGVDGRGIEGLRCLRAEPGARKALAPAKWKSVLREDYARGGFSAWTQGPGAFQLRNKEVRGTASAGAVPWRKYSVRPGFPQDSPSNQATLDAKVAAKLTEDLRVEARLMGAPRLALTLDVGETDGGLTGWTVILVPRGESVEVRLERYDRLIHQAVSPMPAADDDGGRSLFVERRAGEVTVSLAGTVILDRVSAAPLRRRGLRLCTWGRDPALGRIELWRPATAD